MRFSILLAAVLAGCAAPCERSDEIVTVVGATAEHVLLVRSRLEVCTR